MLVGCATTSREQSTVKWAPIDCFHSSLVLVELGEGLLLTIETVHTDLPNHELVVIATTRKSVLVVGAPPESAHFLAMSIQLSHWLGRS